MDTLDRLISIIIYADIVGYSSMMQADEELALSKLKHFEEVIKLQSKKYDGEIVKAYGDGCLMLFPSAVSAIKCAISIQSDLREEPSVPLRIGIHVGEIVRKDHDIFGDGLNIASRIESMGVANSVLISSDIYFQIKNHPEIKTVKLGDFAFKNIERDITLYAISNDGLTVPLSTDMKGKGKINTSSSVFSKKKIRFLWIPIILILGIFLLYNLSDYNFQKIKTEPSGESEISIAVLPLQNLNQNEELEYFSVGVAQEIIDELGKINTIIPTAFSAAYKYKDSKESFVSIANALNVNYIISGSSRIFEDSVKLSIELFDPFSNKRIWYGSYNEVMKNAPSIQLSIAKQVAKSLNVRLSSDEKKSLETASTTDGEAFNLFLKAKAEFLSLTREGLSTSIEMLERVIELDPNYSQAHTFLAWVYMFHSAPWFGGKISHTEYDRLITPYLEKAIALDPKSSDIYLVRANSNVFANGLLREAKKDVEYALALNSWPKTPTTYCICTVVSTYLAIGNLQKAKKYANLGREIDPGNVFIWWDRANIHIIEGEFQKAQALYEEALQVMDIPFFHFFVGWSYYHDGQFSKALPYLENAYKSEAFNFVAAYLSNVHFMLGNQDDADRYRLELEQRMASGEYNLNLAMAMVAAAQTNLDETLTWLEKAQGEKEYTFAYMVNVDPIFKPLYEESRFVEIRRKMQYYDEESSY